MNTTPEERKMIAKLSLRQLLESFPVAGPILNNVLFEFRNQIKQERFNEFVEMLEQEFSKKNIDLKKIQTEENLDLFETIFLKAISTRSVKKREGLKNILLHGIDQKEDIEYCELFADYLLSIHTMELAILHAHQEYVHNGKGPLVSWNDLKGEFDHMSTLRQIKQNPANILLSAGFDRNLPPPRDLQVLKAEYEVAKEMFERYEKEMTAEKFKISKEELKFFLQNSLSKDFLRDDGAGTRGMGTTVIMSITPLGLKFLQFINL